ncbi:MAG: alkaline phosphatase D family protein, partial [Bacteroidota bacterium]
WLPITDNSDNNIVRKISYGNLADIFMLDARTEGRCVAVASPYDTALYHTDRTMLGKKQSDWLTSSVAQSKAQWKVIGNQVVFSELDAHKLTKKHAINPDAWDGYPVERKEILDSFYLHQVKNVIVLTGDIHTSWAFDLVQNPKDKNRYNARTGQGVIGAEFVTPSISSGNLTARVPRGLAKILGSMLMRKATNPHLRFQNMVDHGYILLDLDSTRANATWVFSKSVKKKTEKYIARNSWSTTYNNNRLVRENKL